MTPDWTIPQDLCVRGFRDNRRLYYRILSAIGFCLIRQSSAGPIAILILIVLLIGALPTWPYSSGWGYYPSGGLGLVLVILLIFALMGRV